MIQAQGSFRFCCTRKSHGHYTLRVYINHMFLSNTKNLFVSYHLFPLHSFALAISMRVFPYTSPLIQLFHKLYSLAHTHTRRCQLLPLALLRAVCAIAYQQVAHATFPRNEIIDFIRGWAWHARS